MHRMEITEVNERETFWMRCILPAFLFSNISYLQNSECNLVWPSNYLEKMKAETPTLRQTFIHELVQEFPMPLPSLNFNDRQDDAFL